MNQYIHVPFEEAILDTTGGNPKVLTSTLAEVGRFPVVDQGQNEISGYVDDENLLCRRSNGTVILFGDHTKTIKYVDYNFVLGADGVKVLEARPGFDTRFLFHYLNTISLPNDLGYSRHFKYLKRSIVPKPQIEEQRRIATILDKADAIRKKRREVLKLTDKFLRSLFLDMFGDPVANPKGWPIQPLGSLCQVQTGATPSRDKPDYYGGDIPWVKTGELDQELIIDSEEKITESGINETNCKVFPIGTILVAMYGQGKTRGKCGILGVPASTNQACAALLPSDKIESTYLLYFLKASYESIRAMARGGNQENLNLSIIKGIKIPLPPETLQKRFAAIVNKTANLKTAQNNALQEAKALFASASASAFCRKI